MIVLRVLTSGGTMTYKNPQDIQQDGGALYILAEDNSRHMYSPTGWVSAQVEEEEETDG